MGIPTRVLSRWPDKDPNEVNDYKRDWTDELAGDSIVTSVWTVMSGGTDLVIVSQEFNATKTTIWLSGGSAGVTYILTNEVTTQGGRTLDWSVRIRVAEQ